MGLDISHNTWHGAYSAFMRWREKIAEVAGFPPLELMQGYYSQEENPFTNCLAYAKNEQNKWTFGGVERLKERLPISWDIFEKDPLTELLYHSDCDGDISYGKCKKIAERLIEILPLLPEEDGGGHIGSWKAKTQQFIDGCMLAYSKKEKIRFG